jgi:hypothetical protein
MRTRTLVTLAALASSVLLVPAPAQAAARVSVQNDQGTAKVDPTYATTLRVSGKGFQSIKGGHGGIYVFFGIRVSGGYLYIPDSETKGNQGFQKFVAFPGSDTAASANGGTLKADGTWSTSMVVPGATFQAVNRSGKAQTVDCLKTTCGIITIGAHGVKNANNETFTPVSFADLYGGKAPAPAATTATTPAPAATGGGAAAPSQPAATAPPAAAPAAVAPALTIDQATAVAGRVLTFNAVGLTPGDQVVASLDDGVAAVGPLNVGPNGQVAGVLQLPAGTKAGTHTLKLTGTASNPAVNFPVAAPRKPAARETDDSGTPWLPITFAGIALLVLLGALAFSVTRIRSTRRKATAHAV